MWVINSEENEKKVPSVSYQASLSYHGGAVNALRFSPSGKAVHLALLKSSGSYFLILQGKNRYMILCCWSFI